MNLRLCSKASIHSQEEMYANYINRTPLQLRVPFERILFLETTIMPCRDEAEDITPAKVEQEAQEFYEQEHEEQGFDILLLQIGFSPEIKQYGQPKQQQASFQPRRGRYTCGVQLSFADDGSVQDKPAQKPANIDDRSL